jgi:hypothetical protein
VLRSGGIESYVTTCMGLVVRTRAARRRLLDLNNGLPNPETSEDRSDSPCAHAQACRLKIRRAN